MPAGIYVHIPFCVRKCPYCDFYSLPSNESLRREYVAALVNEAALFPPLAADTLYLGGGTPSLLGADEVSLVIEAARARFSLADDAEITLECNPAAASAAKLRAFRAAGVNRLSVGVQSVDDAMLRAAGRLHAAADALATLRDAFDAGFENVSADVMIGLPRESGAELEKTVDAVCGAGVTHVSAYILKIMENTPFAHKTPNGLPDDDAAAALYERCCELLEARGFEQYEISNFALGERFESRHNKKYWGGGQWIGLGAAAHSRIDGERFSYPRDLERFIAEFRDAPQRQLEPREFLDFEGGADAEEYIMLRLRTREGLSLRELDGLFGFCFDGKKLEFIKTLAREGLARFDGDALSLTRRGLLVSNAIIAELI